MNRDLSKWRDRGPVDWINDSTAGSCCARFTEYGRFGKCRVIIVPPDGWVTASQAARLLSVSTHTVYDWVKCGVLGAKNDHILLVSVRDCAVVAVERRTMPDWVKQGEP